MRDISHLTELDKEIAEAYQKNTKLILDFFDGKHDARTVILEQNVFIDDLYVHVDQLIKSYTNTLLQLEPCQESTLNEVFDKAKEYIHENIEEEGENDEVA